VTPGRRVLAGAAIAVVVVGAGIAAVNLLSDGTTTVAGDVQPQVPVDPDPAVAPSSTRPPLDDPPDPGPVPADHGLSRAELAAAVESSVRVYGPACRGIVREGSGFAVMDGDLVVTIAHLMVGMHEPIVELHDGRELVAVLVAFDAVNDLAVLRVSGAGLSPLPLSEAVPDGTVGAVLAWEAEGAPDPTPFRIDRPVTVRTDIVNGDDRIERQSWLLAAQTEVGDSGAALVTAVDGHTTAVGVAWGASRRGGGGVAYATRAGPVAALLDSTDLDQPAQVPGCD
jgi:S1-C subfamily serine protease